jgi:hypothetical protein
MVVHAYAIGDLAPPAGWPLADAPPRHPQRALFANTGQHTSPPDASDIRGEMLHTFADAAIDLGLVPIVRSSSSKSGYAKSNVEAQPWSDDRVIVTASGEVHRQFYDLLQTLRAPVGAPLLTIVAGESPPKPHDVQDVEERLSRVLDEVRFDDTPLEQVFDRIREETHANISVDWRSLEAAGIDKSTPVRLHVWDVRASTVMSEVLELVGGDTVRLGCRIADGIARVTTGDELAKMTVLRIYDVRTLLKNVVASRRRLAAELGGLPAPATAPVNPNSMGATSAAARPSSSGDPYVDAVDELASIIRETIEPDTWRENGGSIASLNDWAGRLLIQHTPEGHRDIEALLKKLSDAYREEGGTEPSSRPVASKP